MKKIMQRLILPNHPETWNYMGRDENLWVLLHDFELPELYKKPRPSEDQGWPETVNLIMDGNTTIPMDEKIQRFIYGLNPGLDVNSFAPMMDAYLPGTNNKVGLLADFISGKRTNLDFPKFPTNITFGGSIVKVKRKFEKAGIDMLELFTLDPNNLPINPIGYEWAIHDMVTVFGEKINPFPQNGGGRNGGHPCRIGFIASEPVYIQAARARPLDSLFLPNPYRPIWNWNQ